MIQVENIEEFTRVMIDMSQSTNLSSQQAATEFARFANIVGMSQDDFDRLGSSIVDLGNNLATTESEISSMAMRLAGAGAQIGLTEPQILAFSAALSSVGIEAEAGGSSFSKVMVEMQLAAEQGGDKLKAFADVAGVSAQEFKQAFENDAANAIMMFIEGISTAEDRGLSAIGILDEMGLTEVRLRDALLRAAGATDTFNNALEIGNKAWEENTALTEEAEKRYGTTESQMKIMWNRIRDVGIELGEALVPAVMSTLEAIQPLITKIEEGAKAFSELSEEEQQSILKKIALVAAIGPASSALGGLFNVVGGGAKLIGNLSTVIGNHTGGGKGTGLLGRIAGFSRFGVVGLAIGGVAGLAGVIGALTKDKEKLHEISLETANALQEEYATNEAMIEQLNDLRIKSQLSNDEFARYVDLQSQLSDASDPDVIADINEEMAQLQEKSGLSNEELANMVQLNNDLTEALPGTTEKITDQGNAIADNTEKLREGNEELRKRATLEIEEQFHKALENQNILLDQQIDKKAELISAQMDAAFAQDILNRYSEENLDLLRQEMDERVSKMAIQLENGEITQDEYNKMVEIAGALYGQKSELYEIVGARLDAVEQAQKELNETEEQLKVLGEVQDQLEEQYLLEAGINEEKARQIAQSEDEIRLIDLEIAKLESTIDRLERKTPVNQKNTDEYRSQIAAIEEQIYELENAKNKINDNKKAAEEFTKELGKDVDKQVSLFTNPTLESLESRLAAPISKYVDIYERMYGEVPRHKDGTTGTTSRHFIAGEEGFELARHGNTWGILEFGLHEWPLGTRIYPHDESKRILQALNNLPGYANGARPSGEANQIINRLNANEQGDIVVEIPVILEGREVARGTYRYVSEFQNRDREVRESFA